MPPECGFTDQRFEKAVRVYDYGTRWYDPEFGRFLQPDPVVPEPFNPQSLNRYSYVLNDPVNRVDPTGNEPETSFGTRAIEGGGCAIPGLCPGSLPAPDPAAEGPFATVGPYDSPGPFFGARGPGAGPLGHPRQPSGAGTDLPTSLADLIELGSFSGENGPTGVRIAGGTGVTDVQALRRAVSARNEADFIRGVFNRSDAELTDAVEQFSLTFAKEAAKNSLVVGPLLAAPYGTSALQASKSLARDPRTYVAVTQFGYNFRGGFQAGQQGGAFKPLVPTAAARAGAKMGYALGAFDRYIGIERAVRATFGIFD